MLNPQPKDPHIIGLRRPVWSSVKVGYKEPKKNIICLGQRYTSKSTNDRLTLITPPSNNDRLRERPTLSCRTDVM